MKKLLVAGLVLLSLTIYAPGVYAVGGSETIGAQPRGTQPAPGGGVQVTPTATTQTRADAAATAAKDAERRPGETVPDYCSRTNSTEIGKGLCAIANLGSLLGEALSFWGLATVWWILSLTAYTFFIMAEFLMWLGTTLFDNILYLLVVNMGVFIQNTNSNGVQMGWTVIRDLMNIGIIAGFIIVGISTILQSQQYSANRFLARLIIAALLVNFSYFFAGAVIDASNFIATEIYSSKIVSSNKEVCTHTLKEAKSLSYLFQGVNYAFIPEGQLCSISKTFTETLQLGSWPELRSWARNNTEANEDSNKTMFFIGMIGGFFYVIVGFIFFSAAVLLIGRFIVLILLLITSPVGVAGTNIPYLDEYANKWWSMLFSQAFFAPVFIMLVGIGLHIIHDTNKILVRTGAAGTTGYSAIASGDWGKAISVIPMFISFFIGVAFMYAALQIARSMSESGKEYVGAIYDGLQKRIGTLYGDIYQATAGQTLRLPSLAYDSTIGQLSRIPLINQIPGVRQITQGVGMMLRPDQGAHPFGSALSNADAAKNMQEYAKSLEGFGFLKALGKPDEAFKKFTHAIGVPLENAFESFMGESVAALMARDAKGEKLTPAQRRKIARYVEHLSEDDLNGMTSSELAEIAPYMSVKQFTKTMDRSDLNDNQRKEIQESRWAKILNEKDKGKVAEMIDNLDKTERKILFTDRDDVRTDKQILAALGSKTYEEVINDSSLYGGQSKEWMDSTRGVRAEYVAKNPGKMSDADAKFMTSEHISDEQIGALTPAQARRLHQHTKDPKLRAKIVERFPEIFGATPSQTSDDEEEETRKQKEKDEEEAKKQKEEEEAEAKKKKEKEQGK